MVVVTLVATVALAGVAGHMLAPLPSSSTMSTNPAIMFQANASGMKGDWIGSFYSTAPASDLVVLFLWINATPPGCGPGFGYWGACSYWLNDSRTGAPYLSSMALQRFSSVAGQVAPGPVTLTVQAQNCSTGFLGTVCDGPLAFNLSVEVFDAGPAAGPP